MSRIGRKPIEVPGAVQLTLDGSTVTVKGPKGQLQRTFSPEMRISVQEESGKRTLLVERPSDQPRHRALHGLTRALLANMVNGVVSGFRKELELDGTGYRAEVQGKSLILNVGYSHPVQFDPPDGISFEVGRVGQGILVAVNGPDKELVGEIAARIRKVRPVEPYLGKGLHYVGEHVRRKAGKTGR